MVKAEGAQAPTSSQESQAFFLSVLTLDSFKIHKTAFTLPGRNPFFH